MATLSPHFNGIASVKSFKHHIVQCTYCTSVQTTFEEFLVQIEAILNTSPLFHLSKDPHAGPMAA